MLRASFRVISSCVVDRKYKVIGRCYSRFKNSPAGGSLRLLQNTQARFEPIFTWRKNLGNHVVYQFDNGLDEEAFSLH